MQIVKKKFFLPTWMLLLALLPGLCAAVLLACSDRQESDQSATAQSSSGDFTFFDLGPASVLTDSVRGKLRDRLGNDAIESRNVIDLEINFNGFLEKYFPALADLNRKLNYPPGERVEHNTVKLMYRYAQKKKVPFDYVELIFSQATGHPLLFKIEFSKDESRIVETLKAKHGRPREIQWNQARARALYWKKDGQVMVISMVPDQYGNLGYQIDIYYAANIKKLLRREQLAREKMQQQEAKTGQNAF